MLGDENSLAGPLLELPGVESGSALMKEQGLSSLGLHTCPRKCGGTWGMQPQPSLTSCFRGHIAQRAGSRGRQPVPG